MINKYSKPSADFLRIKSSFFTDNESLLKENLRLAKVYSEQPRRTKCKICEASLKELFFTKQSIDYFRCSNCGHINGAYDDTPAYAWEVYINNADYAKFYISENKAEYLERVNAFYKPKAEFLLECLFSVCNNPRDLSIGDIGCGSGYFVYALKYLSNFNQVTGYEVSSQQVALANSILEDKLVNQIDFEDLSLLLQNCHFDVISMIGVLEHLREPRLALKSISENNNIRFLFLLLPLFSHSIFFEAVNQDIFNKQLWGGHTHLFTQESMQHFCKEFGFEIIGTWYFGEDMIDLFRFYYVRLEKLGLLKLRDFFVEKFSPLIDEMQKIIDRTEFCDQVHFLLKKTPRKDTRADRKTV